MNHIILVFMKNFLTLHIGTMLADWNIAKNNRNNPVFGMSGQNVGQGFTGVVIKNGRKVLRK